jgi:hypothetical protein
MTLFPASRRRFTCGRPDVLFRIRPVLLRAGVSNKVLKNTAFPQGSGWRRCMAGSIRWGYNGIAGTGGRHSELP